jgi:superfamily II DNA or RNA helicase
VRKAELKAGTVVSGPLFPEPVQVVLVQAFGASVKMFGKGLRTERMYDPILTEEQLESLQASPEKEPFDGDPVRFRLGVEAMRLGLAYEYDPYFSLSIARVDPLPHQLEAVYDYFLKLPRIRFLLADDPGAGKTIMAGLLIKELKIRGLVKRTLIVTPANLSFQWQRELKDKFREQFEVVRSDVLRANYGSNPWQDKNQVITSVSWVSRVEDARDALLRSHWDLIIVDEAHKMSAYSADKKTLAFQLGEQLSQMTDHFLLMTATPHKGDAENFCLFLSLLDKDVYGDVRSLEEAMTRQEAPFYLRRVKEALVTFPDPETGKVKALFTRRIVKTSDFAISEEEFDLYDQLTRYVENQSIRAARDDSARGRAVGFTMAMLQRRFASSTYAVRRSLERMKEKRERILENPEKYRQEQIAKRLPDDFDELPEDEQQELVSDLEATVASFNPEHLREEISDLAVLIRQAKGLEAKEQEVKVRHLKKLLMEKGLFADPTMKLLIFTEHKDTLDFLVGDGREGRPLGKLREWGLTVTQIHGGMKIGDRDTPGTRIYSEREFRETCQVLVATEAAGEGINLQFCWVLINYDIPWNPVRLEQRMGRIHRYGQEKDCLIFNFVTTNTREGRVMQKLFERIEQIELDLDPNQTGKVFNVLGDLFPANQLERMLRDMYAHNNMTEELIKQRIVEEVDTDRFKSITASTLEGLAKKELNLSAILGKSAEARERRLVPEVIQDFFLQAAPVIGMTVSEPHRERSTFRVGRVPRHLWAIGERLEPRFGRLGHEYKQVVFDKEKLKKDPTADWVTPGHPLFEVVREDLSEQVRDDLARGAVFFDMNCAMPARFTVFSSSIRDGRGNELHRRLFIVLQNLDGKMELKQPTFLLDLVAAPKGTAAPDLGVADEQAAEHFLVTEALQPFVEEIKSQRLREIETISRHMEISLNELIHRQNLRMAELHGQLTAGSTDSPVAANIKLTEDKLEELNGRLERRRVELAQERHCTISDIRRLGAGWLLPHPDRTSPGMAAFVRDEEIERIAVDAVTAMERARGWEVESVETENRGFDLISRRPHPEDPATALEVRFIEVKGRAGVGEVALSSNEYRTAQRLREDYWLYVVFNCATSPEVKVVRDPALQVQWEPVVRIEQYHVKATAILEAAS